MIMSVIIPNYLKYFSILNNKHISEKHRLKRLSIIGM